MADNQTTVVYKAIADFSALSRAARKAKKDLRDLRNEEAALNAQSVASSNAATAAAGKQAKGREQLVKQFESEAGATRRAAAATFEHAAAARQNAQSVNLMTGEITEAEEASNHLTNAVKRTAAAFRDSKNDSDGFGRSQRTASREMSATEAAMRRVMGGAGRLNKQLERLGNWRPRLIPPFIALVPVIGGVLALINPLIAGLGGVATAALGFASSLGRVAAGAIGAVPALATLMSVVFALKTAFGGIGGAFKAFGAMKDAAGGGGGGGAPAKAELTRTEQLTRAQEKYARSIQDVQWAQEDLDDARKDYIKRLNELQKAVDRAAMSEARAAANSQLARENYANVLADPGSTKGEKMDAKVGVDEANADYQDTIDENKQNAADLAKMKKDGMELDREVIRAQRALTDAINAQRDAQLELINTQNGANEAAAGGAGAVDQYAAALAKLSPSARKFVENLVSLNEEWTALKKNVQERFFKHIADDVLLLRNIFPSLEHLLGQTADALGRVASNFIKLVTSPGWQKDLMIIGDQNVPIIENVGRALLAWVDAFKDLAIIAGPFLADLTKGLADGAENFRAIIGQSRETGELAAYLEKVRNAMSQWWRIIKNIGMTLFNYSAAAGSFGEWLTDGFEKVTEGWRDASEAARREGSPFQEYLENIKPLITETKGLFSDFFGWLSRTMMDPENIRIWTEMVGILRDRLGPAISRILDILTKSEVGEGLIEAISSIVEFIATFLENGGLDGFKAFYDAVTMLFDILNQVASLVPAPVLSLLATTFGTLAALQFFGLSRVLGQLLKLGKGGTIKKLADMAKNFVGLGEGGFLSLGGKASKGAKGAAAGKSAVGASVPAGMTRAEYRAATGQAAKGGSGVISSVGSKAAAAGKSGFNLLGSIGKGAGKGFGLGAIASIAGSVIGDLISSGASEGGAGAGQRVGGNALSGAASGAGIGALIGSIIPGLGTAVGAGVGGLIGGGVGVATSNPEDIQKMLEDWGNFFADVGAWLADVWNGFMNWLTVDMPGWLGGVWDGFMNWLTLDLPAWVASIGEGFMNWLTVDLPYQLGVAVGLFYNWLTIDLPAWLAGVWDGFMTWLTVDMPAWLATVWNGFLNWLTVDLPNWIAQAANNFWNWLTVEVPAWIGQAANAFWNWLTVQVPGYIGTAANAFWNWLTVEVPGYVKTAGDSFWQWLTVDLPGWVQDVADGFWRFLTVDIPNWFQDALGGIGDFFGGIFGNFQAGFDSTQKKRNGGVIHRSNGGGVPGSGNSDTVPAMLTPGEFVIRKEVTSRVGPENLAKFNAGVMSYAQLLQTANKSKTGKNGTGGGFGAVQMLNGGGLVPDFGGFGNGTLPPGGPGDFGGAPGHGGGVSFGDIHIHNPEPETASDSLARTIRKAAYVGGGK